MDYTTTNGTKPPGNLPYERGIADDLLAEAMHDPGIVLEAGADLLPQVFLDPEHRTIWQAIRETFEAAGTISPLLVAETLERKHQLQAAGGVENLTRLAEAKGYAVHYGRHIEILREHHGRRRLIEMHTRRAACAADLSVAWADVLEFSPVPDITSDDDDNRIQTAAEFFETDWTMPPAIVDGLIRRGETCNVIAASKAGKSWLVYGLALAIATGRRWLDRFETVRGRVLIVDNELMKPILLHRLAKVGHAMGLERSDWTDRIEILFLRGKLADIHQVRKLAEKRSGIDLVTLDALYRALPAGTSENDNGQMTAIYNELDAMAAEMNSAVVCVHHASKGAQSGKSITDRGSGAGAISRAADSHITIIPHLEPGFAVVEAVVRSFEPPQPFGIAWQYPLWVPASDDIDLSAVQGAAQSTTARTVQREQERDEAQRTTADRRDADVLALFETKPDQWRTADDVAGLVKLSFANTKKSLIRLVEAKKLAEHQGNRANSRKYLLSSSLSRVLEQEQRQREQPDNEKYIHTPPHPPRQLSGCREATPASLEGEDDIPTTVGLSDCRVVGKKQAPKQKTAATKARKQTTATTATIVEAVSVTVTSKPAGGIEIIDDGRLETGGTSTTQQEGQ